MNAGTYWVVVDGFGDSSSPTGGPYTIDLTEEGPCGDIPSNGTCVAPDEVSWCITPPAGIMPLGIASATCQGGDVCRVIEGVAGCYPPMDMTECTRELTFCDGDVLVSCDGPGPANRQTCEHGCVSRLQGAYCARTTPWTLFGARMTYEYRVPNAELSDWSGELRTGSIRRAVVFSGRQVDDRYEIFDTGCDSG